MNISGINLNLLVAFDVLCQEQNVTRAAKRLRVTQPAMSNTLSQLRVLFQDPLFRRTAHGLEPTPRALELAGPVRHGLRILGAALAPPSFEPASAERTFVVAASDYVEFVLLAPLLRCLTKQAPGVRIHVRSWGKHEVPTTLARGEADLMIGFHDALPASHRAMPLFEEEYVCIARRGHPGIGRRLTLDTYLALDHVLVSEQGDTPGSVDRALAARGKRRRVAVRVSHFSVVPALVAGTDLVAAISRRVALPFAKSFGLQVLVPPIPLPRGKIGQVWHEQMNEDPAHRWLRGTIETVSREL